MTASIPKTKYQEFAEELDTIERLPRQQAVERLVFFSRRLAGGNGKNHIDPFDMLTLKARLARLQCDVYTLNSLSSGITSLGGDLGRWRQFNNLVHLGRLQDGYELIKEVSPDGHELTGCAWLALIHSLAGNFSAASTSLAYISRAYPNCEHDYPLQFAMAKTAHTLVKSLQELEDKYNLCSVLQAAIEEAVPTEMLQIYGVAYRSGTVPCPDGEEVFIELLLMPDEHADYDLSDIMRCFSRVIQHQLPDDVTDKLIFGLSFMDELE